MDRLGSIDWTIRHAKPFRGSVSREHADLVTDPEVAGLLRAIGVHDSLTVPLVARGRTPGAIAVLQAESGRYFDDD